MDGEQRFRPVVHDASYALRRWMLDHDVSVKRLAAEIGVNEVIISSWRTGKHKPGRTRALKLERLTGGSVAAELWDEPC
jgi:predicted transcriptional regulator